MDVWAPEQTDPCLMDTMPPAIDDDRLADIRRMLPKLAERANTSAACLRVIDVRADEANRAISRGAVRAEHLERIQAARAATDSALASLREGLGELVAEMARTGQEPELYELDLAPGRVEPDIARVRLGVYDRWPTNETPEKYASPIATMARWYERLEASLRSYQRDLESPFSEAV